MAFTPPASRFWPKVDRRDDDQCWPWLGARTTRGYGNFMWAPGRIMHAHRAAWMIAHEGQDVPAGLDVDHLCFNTGCVNPAHLEAVTRAENMNRRRAATASHCQRGHAFGDHRDNTNGRRFCIECRRLRDRKRRPSRRALLEEAAL